MATEPVGRGRIRSDEVIVRTGTHTRATPAAHAAASTDPVPVDLHMYIVYAIYSTLPVATLARVSG